MYTVYKHTTPGGKVYIGITSKSPAKRWENGGGYRYNKHFSSAIKLYGWENIKHEVIKDGLTRSEAAALEIELIALYDSTNPAKGYNKSTGGECSGLGVRQSEETRQRRRIMTAGENNPFYNQTHTPEARQKMSEARKGKPPANKGKPRTAEQRQRLSEAHRGKAPANKGQPMSEEQRQKISEANKGREPWNKGRPMSEEHKQRLIEANRGREPWNKGKPSPLRGVALSEETKAKIGEAHKGKKASAEARQRMSEAHKGQPSAQSKSVICLTTGVIYRSATEAARAVGTTQTAISRVCRGERNKTKGLSFAYLGDLQAAQSDENANAGQIHQTKENTLKSENKSL